MTLLEDQQAVVLSFFKHLNENTFDQFQSQCSVDFVHILRPASLEGAGKPDGRTADEFNKSVNAVHQLVESFGFQQPKDLVQVADKVVVWIETHGITATRAYTNEYMYWFYFQSGSTKISKIVEMDDSLYVSQQGLAALVDPLKA